MKFATFFTGGVVPGTVRAGKAVVADANKAVDTLDIIAAKINGVALGSSAAEVDRIAKVTGRLVTVAATPLTAALATHEGKTVVLSLATGIDVTLPAATGSGARYRFVIGVANTSTNVYTIATAPTTDVFAGFALVSSDNGSGADFSWPTAATSNKITLGGTSHATGGNIGDTVELEDIAAGIWACRVTVAQGGTEATPFSHV